MELVRVETQQHRAQVDFLLMGIDGGINVGAIERSIDFDVLGQSINISASETTADSEVSLHKTLKTTSTSYCHCQDALMRTAANRQAMKCFHLFHTMIKTSMKPPLLQKRNIEQQREASLTI